jgi:hypothetical protein
MSVLKNILFVLAVLVSSVLVSAYPAAAQVTTADVVGRVTDPKGLAVAGAKVTVSSPSTGLLREAVSADTGDFAVTLIPPGTYKITVEKQGFSTVVYEQVELVVGQKRDFDVALKIGISTTTVMVTEEVPLIETTSSQIQGSVAPLEMKELPVVDRNFAGLMTLVPGVRPAENFDPTKTRSGNISVNGTDGRAVDYNVDGGDNKDNVIGGLVQNFTIEGILEFNVVTDRYTAESGRAVGAVVNVISKSGTNQLHGSLLGLFQNNGLNAALFDIPSGHGNPPKFHRYQYGGSVGGPIVKDKLFFFGAFEQKREPGNIPSGSDAIGQLTALSNVDPASLPTISGPLAVPISGVPFPYIDDLVTVKMDWRISDKQSFYARYGREKWTNPNDQLGNPVVTDASQTNSDVNQFHSLVLSHNYVFSSNKINTFAVQFQDFVNAILPSPSRSFTVATENGVATNPEICFLQVVGCGGGAPEVEVGQNVNVPQETLIRKYQFRDDFNWIMGRHNMKFGANYIYLAKLGGFFFFGANGYQVTFFDLPQDILSNPGLYPQGLSTPGAVAEMTLSGGSGNTAQPPAHEIGLYYQDDFKVNQKLTLNLGLRWDANPTFLVPQLTNSADTTNRAIAVLQEVLAAPGVAADPVAADGLARAQEIAGNNSKLRKTTASWKQFQPRIGFAWNPTGTGKYVIRGGYGIARDQIFQNLTLFSIQEEQQTLYQTFFDRTSSATGSNCLPGTPPEDLCNFRFGVDPLPVSNFAPTDLAPGGTGRIIDPNMDDPWSQQMSIGVQYQLSNDYAASVDYYHVIGNHEPRVLQMNPVLASLCDGTFPTSNPLDPRCINGAKTRLLDVAFEDAGLGIGRLGELRDYSTNTRSIYDGINLHLQKRLSHRIMFQFSDVISWSRGWGGLPTSSYGGSALNIDPAREFLPGEFGPTNFDERNRFSASGVFQLPYGFEVAPIFQASTARPFTALAGHDLDGDGRSTLDRACADGSQTPGCTEFAVNSFRGKAFIELDLRTSYTINIRENMHLHLLWEMYNVFNRNNSCNFVDTNFYGGSFGAPQGYCGGQGPGATFGNAYRSQFGLRFEF